MFSRSGALLDVARYHMVATQQGWTPYLTAHLKLTLAVPRGGTFFLLSRSIPRSRSLLVLSGPLGVVELEALPTQEKGWLR